MAVGNGDSFYVHAAGVLANQYVIRYRSAGVNVDIACVNGNQKFAPELAQPTDKSTQAGTSDTLQLVGWDPDGGTVTFTSSALPAGLDLDAASGLISGTPTTPSTTQVTVTVKDDEGVETSRSFTWTVTEVPVVTPDCVVTPNGAGGVLVDWKDVAGVSQYNVRSNGAFVSAVNNGDSFYVHTTGVLANQYVIRYRAGGVNVDITCVNG
jgi:hypothetical protein